MPTHNIIDNQTEKLVDHINQILASADSARFASGVLRITSPLLWGRDVTEKLYRIY